MKIPDIFNQSLRRLIFGSGCHVWYAMRVCLCFNPDLNDSLFDELIKRPNIVKYRWFLGISGWRVTCRGVNIYWMQSLRLETEAECCVDTRQCVLGVEQTTVRARREERDSVGVRSVREPHHMCHVTHHVSSRVVSLLVTCHNCEVWLKLSQVVINLSLWMWQEEFANKTFPHLSIESQHQTVRTASMRERDTWHWW